jgi:predicted amidohydrolase
VHTIRVTAVQFELRAETSFDAFAGHVMSVVETAAAAGTDLVVLPELATTGLLASHPGAGSLTIDDLPAAYREVFPPLTDPLVELLRELAMRLDITVLGGSHFRRAEDGSHRNTAHLAHPDGRIERQDKLHLTPQEQAMGLQPGDDVLISRIGPARIGVQICADIEFPEINRYLARQGVDLILCPSLTWNTRGANRVRYGAHARAMENQCFVVTSPLVGTSGVPATGAIHGTGYAMVAGPIDRTLGLDDGVVAAHQDTRAEGSVTAELDLDLIVASRANPEPPGLSNVRPPLYARFDPYPSEVAR